MKYLHLVWAALFHHRVRTILTLFSVLAAFLLFGLLESVRSAFANSGQSVAGLDRMITTSTVAGGPLPTSLHASIQRVPGVVAVSYGTWISGFYQNPRNRFEVEAVSDNFFDLFPEWRISPNERQTFQSTRTGAIVGASLARKFNWKPGDRIPFRSSAYQKDGSDTWTFDLVGTYEAIDPKLKMNENILFFHWSFLDEARRSNKGTVAWYMIKVANPLQADRIGEAIDALSANSDHETKTQSQSAYRAYFVRQFADIGLIVGSIMGAVFFTLILLAGNTMMQAARERIREFAILKTLGFTGSNVMTLLLCESVLLLLLGAILGLAASASAVGAVRSTLGATVPIQPLAGVTWLRGLTLSILIGVIVGALPALHGMRVRIVDALSRR